ncbi:MAG: bifunctional DNA-formamidopyrimidine glycosylase/DNA-(apurinic or apyrimidinic site) lyase [Hyphomicrobiales bacterium]|nr:bifunctional DNA-formamidopyrimidine glycosylase/DNA-(apurinic or apyrimidinic site) lyase [Hyphomicrobiales bacterium]
MPELPEVETVRRGLAPFMEGAAFTRVELRRANLRFPFPERFAERLVGRRIEALDRRAKYLMARLDDGATLAMHLGMTGRFTIELAGGAANIPGDFVYQTGRNAIHDHVLFALDNGVSVRFNDARRFGYMTLIDGMLERHPLFEGIGVEPLSNELTPEYLAKRAAGKIAPLKSFLLDQRVIAGLGNIYVSEALFRAGLRPTRPAAVLATKSRAPTAACERLVAAILVVLEEAILAGGSSLRDFAGVNGAPGYFQHTFGVYGRTGEPCLQCGVAIERIVQSGRSSFFCPRCQR